jgi:hypothetical protein
VPGPLRCHRPAPAGPPPAALEAPPALAAWAAGRRTEKRPRACAPGPRVAAPPISGYPSAALPPGPPTPHRPQSLSGQITCQNPADTSLVKQQAAPHRPTHRAGAAHRPRGEGPDRSTPESARRRHQRESRVRRPWRDAVTGRSLMIGATVEMPPVAQEVQGPSTRCCGCGSPIDWPRSGWSSGSAREARPFLR